MPLLGPNGQPLNAPAFEESAPEQDAGIEATGELAEPAITPCRTAFTVFIMEDGSVLLSDDLVYDGTAERPPTFDEMTHGCAVAEGYAVEEVWLSPNTEHFDCLTAFTPYLTHDGRWLVSADLNDALVPDREATPDDIIGGAAVVRATSRPRRSGRS